MLHLSSYQDHQTSSLTRSQPSKIPRNRTTSNRRIRSNPSSHLVIDTNLDANPDRTHVVASGIIDSTQSAIQISTPCPLRNLPTLPASAIISDRSNISNHRRRAWPFAHTRGRMGRITPCLRTTVASFRCRPAACLGQHPQRHHQRHFLRPCADAIQLSRRETQACHRRCGDEFRANIHPDPERVTWC